MQPARILVVDDHPLVREGFNLLLSEAPDLKCAYEAESLATAQAIIEKDKPDVAIVDLGLGSDDGTRLVRWIHDTHPQVRILVLSMQDEDLIAEHLLRLGASGYLMKNAAPADLVQAVRRVARGQKYVSPRIAERLILQSTSPRARKQSADPLASLSDRERQVFNMTTRGASTRDIADTLQMSVKTVDAHRRHIREKLRLKSTSDLLRYAAEWAARSDS